MLTRSLFTFVGRFAPKKSRSVPIGWPGVASSIDDVMQFEQSCASSAGMKEIQSAGMRPDQWTVYCFAAIGISNGPTFSSCVAAFGAELEASPDEKSYDTGRGPGKSRGPPGRVWVTGTPPPVGPPLCARVAT